MEEIQKLIDCLEGDGHQDLQDKWADLSSRVWENESRSILFEEGNQLRDLVSARVETLEVELDSMKRLSKQHKELNQTMTISMSEIVKMGKCIGSLNNLINTLEINKVVRESEDSESELETPLHVFRSGFISDLIKKVDDMLEIELENAKHLAKKQRNVNETIADTLEHIDELNDIMDAWENVFNIEEIREIKKDSRSISQQVQKTGFNSDLIEDDKKLVDKLKILISRLRKNLCTLQAMWPHIDEMMDSISKIDYRPPTSIIEQLHKRVQHLERNDHRDIHEKWDIVSQKIANGESPRYLIEDAKNFKHHFVARIGMLQAELDTYIRLVDKQKGLNQMMSSRILQQTIMERDNSIKKELNWLGSWFGIGSSASLQQKLKFNGSEEDGEGSQYGVNQDLYRKGKAFEDKLKEKIRLLRSDQKTWKMMLLLVEDMIVFWNKGIPADHAPSPVVSYNSAAYSYVSS